MYKCWDNEFTPGNGIRNLLFDLGYAGKHAGQRPPIASLRGNTRTPVKGSSLSPAGLYGHCGVPSHDRQNQPYGQWGTSRLAAQPGGQGMRTWSGRTGGVQVEGVDRGENSNLAASQAANMKQTRSLPLDNYSAIAEDRSTSIKYNACRHIVSRGPRLIEDTEYTCDCHLKPRVGPLTRGRDHNQCQWHRKTICAARQATLDRNGPRGPPRAAMQQGPRHVPGA